MFDDLAARLAALEADHASLRAFTISGAWHALDRIYELAGRDLQPACLGCGKALPLAKYAGA